MLVLEVTTNWWGLDAMRGSSVLLICLAWSVTVGTHSVHFYSSGIGRKEERGTFFIARAVLCGRRAFSKTAHYTMEYCSFQMSHRFLMNGQPPFYILQWMGILLLEPVQHCWRHWKWGTTKLVGNSGCDRIIVQTISNQCMKRSIESSSVLWSELIRSTVNRNF